MTSRSDPIRTDACPACGGPLRPLDGPTCARCRAVGAVPTTLDLAATLAEAPGPRRMTRSEHRATACAGPVMAPVFGIGARECMSCGATIVAD